MKTAVETIFARKQRLIQNSLREWAYAHAYRNSQQQKAELPRSLYGYKWGPATSGR